MDLQPRTSAGATVEPISNGWRFSIPAGESGKYRLSQLDNCTRNPRKQFPYTFLEMKLRARVSSQTVRGTWGFGAWNDPYRLAVGPGETIFQALTLPNAAWFFYSPEMSHLSFRDDKPGHGFLAQVFRAERFPLLPLAGVAATFLFSRPRARRMLSRLISEEAVELTHDVTQWHEYGMTWDLSGVSFKVDQKVVLETPLSPKAPLGLVIWIDNQYAAFDPQGRVAFGALSNPEQWMEVEGVEMVERSEKS